MDEAKQEIAGVIITASPARPQAPFDGAPVLETVLSKAMRWGLATPLVVVFGRDNEHLVESIDLGAGIAVLDEDGSSRSSAISVGLDAVSHVLPDAIAALIIDSDVPGVPEGTVPALIDSLATSGRMAAAPTYRYVRGGPVLLGRQLWDRVMASDSEQRLEEFLAAHPDWASTVVISEPAPEPVH
ncbi:MAG: NTP transferase domain-containing protein [Acidimicrobiia bacterium]|nr:NTP transferase domain-containing protein [Acidimicrobiia bacterium]